MCSQIPASFFAPHASLHKDGSSSLLYGPQVPHWPVDLLQESAVRGCPLCVILAGTVDADFLPPDVRRRTQTCLRRGILDPHENRSPEEMEEAEISPLSSFALYVGIDDISHGQFFQVPHPWCSGQLWDLHVVRLIISAGDRYLPPLLASPTDDVSLGAQWLADCLKNHSKCAGFASLHVPTRLLYLSAFQESDLDFQLIESADLPRYPSLIYATLSHCWGCVPESAPWKTTTINVHQHRKRIEHKSMTETFRDAVQICRALGINYLWIDSLCIIQDSQEDWEQEAGLIGNVYMGSLINLAACSSKDGQGGCRRDFHNSGRTEASRYYDLGIAGSKFRLFERRPRSWDDTYKATHLHKRGWVVQERELAPRAIHYCKDTVLWECKTSKASSELPWFEMRSKDQEPDLLFNSLADAEPYDDSLANPFYKSLDISPTSRALGMRHYWFSLVEEYSEKLLSRESDRLPALDGLAQASSDPIKGPYLAGIWREEMPSALLWRITTPVEKQSHNPSDFQSTRIPSWSWASAGYGVTYDSQKSWIAHNAHNNIQYVQRECDFESFSIRDAQIQTRTHHCTSEILGGSLLCSGLIFRLTVGKVKEKYLWSNQFVSVCSHDHSTVGILYPDMVVNRLEVSHIFFTPVRSELGGYDGVPLPSDVSSLLDSTDYVRGATCMGIGMIPTSSIGQVYRRIGLVRFVRKNALQKRPVVDFEIV
jgi:Heterokaryon incompatibility protein (HET)